MSDLVIFDLDGVLVDTQEAENGGLAHLSELMGLPIDPNRARELFSGRKMQECVDLIAELARTPPPPDAVSIARARCEELIGTRLDPIDGVYDALNALAVPRCVASNSPRDLIVKRLRAAGVLHHFGDRLFSAYDVGAWKPDPRLFLQAAAACDSHPERCVVVEDSEVGVEAALAAGMRVLQYTADPGTPPHRRDAVTFSSMRALPALVASADTAPPNPHPDPQ